MTIPVNKLLKIVEKIKGKLLGVTCSYLSAKVIGLVDDADNMQQLWELKGTLLDMTLPSNILLWLGIIATILVYLSDWILSYISKSQNPSVNFRNIMTSHTADVIAELSSKTYSWGYNYCIHFSRNPRGWSPDAFFVKDYETARYSFPYKEDENLPGYCKLSFEEYRKSEPKIETILRKNEDRDRIAVSHAKCNLNRNVSKVEIELQKTSWVQLQYSWDYFRLLDAKTNQKIETKSNQLAIQKALQKAFEGQGGGFFINSFCLHLLIETKNGVILSRISQTKNNDYASTWAATIGEQIEENDFYIVGNDGSSYRKNFVEQWTKRALEEEFGINQETEYEDVVEPTSLKVLSVDMEADIYNVALTCVIRLRQSFDDFIREHGSGVDRLENFELRECTLKEIRQILLGYPENQKLYHPSTYLRLLMFHRYREGTKETEALIYQDKKKLEI